MLKDLKDIAQDATIEADLCIVGAGAAGLTLARAFMDTPLSVCLLESGGLDFESTVANLGAGSNQGMPYYDIEDSRLRFFGGTTNIWGGRCVPLDPEDFENRPWIPHSGWPIRIEDLASGYQRAHADLGIGAPLAAGEGWQRLKAELPDYLAPSFTSSLWYFDEQTERFAASRCADLFAAPNLTIITHAHVLHLQARPDAGGLSRLEFGGLDGKRARVVARAYVLAAGGIENPRLLLASRDVEHSGIGNRTDQVGRYFMEHPHGRLGRVDSSAAFALWSAFEKRFPSASVPLAPVLRARGEVQAEEGILNTALTFKLQRAPEVGLALNKRAYQTLKHQLNPTSSNRLLWHGYNRAKRLFQRHRTPLVKLATRTEGRNVYAMIRGEQAPNPASRILLSEQRDALGQPRADLHWRLSEVDKRTLRVLASRLDSHLQAAGLGSFAPEPWLEDDDPAWPVDPTVGNHPIGGYHHMGTTRMADRPEQGVVDKNCQVFGYSNLYVAGSSVFTTAGWANPTLTILALAHRLADHLKKHLNDA